ncbi:hypothetical protein EN898_32965, partial [Mesorhizobium sp. M7A.F.Ca.CA.001.06.1.1]
DAGRRAAVQSAKLGKSVLVVDRGTAAGRSAADDQHVVVHIAPSPVRSAALQQANAIRAANSTSSHRARRHRSWSTAGSAILIPPQAFTISWLSGPHPMSDLVTRK